MRLHHLRVQALQAFARTAEVDFDALSDAGLFLLHGDTGAGKTTLLDAVCFALFGKLPGTRGSQARERADLAAAELPTEVVLELTLRGERLRITRTPKQERPKVRGTGTTTVAPTVLLEAVAADGGTRALANRHEEVALELDRLLGMSREQFCQVVLLPQGQFATFLHAKSDDREELLARLFGTERFEDAERWLTDRRRKADEAMREALKDIADSASKLHQVLQAEPPEGWEGAPSLLAAWADDAQVVGDAELAAATGVCDRVQAERTAADEALAAVRDLLRLRERHAHALADLTAFEARTDTRDAAERVLALARSAAVVQPLLAVASGDARHAAAAREAADAACAAVGMGRCAPDALRELAAGHRTAAGEARGLTAVEHELATRAGQLRSAAAQAGELQAEVERADAWLAGAQAQLATLTAAAEAGRLAVVREDEHDAAALQAATLVEAGRRRDALAGRIGHDRTRQASAKEAELQAREAWLQLREQRLNGMAAELADGLQDGAPCLVCGALEHPEPAAHLISGQVTAAEEGAAQDTADVARAAREEIDRELADAGTQHAAAVAVAGDTPVAALEAAAQTAQAQAEATAAAAAGAAAAVLALATHDADRASAEQGRTRAVHQRVALADRIAEWEAAQAQDAARLADALDGATSVAERVRGLEALAAAHDEAAAAVERAEQAVAAAERSGARATSAALAAGFAGLKTAAAAVLDEAGMQEREAFVRRHDEGLAERRRLVHDPELVGAVAAPEPDEAAAMTAARTAAEADAEAGRSLERVRGRAESLRTLRRELARRLTAHGPAAAEAAMVRALATLVDGTSSQNRKRMRLRAYVLAARLEEIAAAASVRLQVMTAGRYTLAHDDERASRTTRSGLGLRVVDGWTGRDRHPSSLSGGETFLASLALALGLADVVAAEAGGARLETLFVDEGFGSLDERALDEVLDVLDRLRDGGRAVGVVSHVAELRQRITAQLHVVKERDGSRVVQAA
jgi:exonuclease SbcC